MSQLPAVSEPPAGARAERPGRLVVAIDGPSGAGKSTVARRLARQLGARYLDTGAMYRAVTLCALEQGIDPADAEAVAALARRLRLSVRLDPARPAVFVDGRDVTDEVRSGPVTAAVSAVSAVPGVRAELVRIQQAALTEAGPIVVEGRDIGTVVAPDANVKVFLTATPETRAHRRNLELTSSITEPLAGTAADLARRDALDSSRSVSPLTRAPDAVELDTTAMDADTAVATILQLVHGGAAAQGSTAPAAGGPLGSAPQPPRAPRPPLVRSRGRPHGWFVRFARAIGRILMPTYFRLRVTGREHVPRSGPVLLAGNHTSFLDGPLVFCVAPRIALFYVKEEMYDGPVARPLDWLGQIPINRGRPDRRALRRGLSALRAGDAVGMFPEGSRGAGDLGSVQHGIAFLALKAGCPVVPVACLGSAAALPPGKGWPRWRAPIQVVFGPPFRVATDVDPHARRAVAEAAEQIRVRLAAHVAAAGGRAQEPQ